MEKIFKKFNSTKFFNNSPNTDIDPKQKLKQLKEVSKQFEAIFINQLLKQARNAKISDGIFDSNGEDTFNSMIDQKYSEILSKKSNFGISESLFNQFKSQFTSGKK